MDVSQLVNDLMNETNCSETNTQESADTLQSLGFTLNSPHGGLWASIQNLVRQPKPLTKAKPHTHSPYKFYQIEEVLNYLMEMSQEIDNEKEKDFLQGGLMYLHDQVDTPKYQRDQSSIREAWYEIYPVIAKYNMLEVFPKGSWSRERIMVFLLGNY